MRICFDIETDGFLDALTKVHIIAAKDVDTGKSYDFKPHEIEQGLELLSQAEVLIAHNGIQFDIPALQKVYPNWTYKAQVKDTLVISRLIWSDLKNRDETVIAKGRLRMDDPKLIGSHSLAAWGMRLKEHKGDYEGGWDEWNEEMHLYAIQDVEVTDRLWKLIEKKEYSQRAIDLEHRVADIMARCERHGFSFDVDAAHGLHVELSKHRSRLETELQDTFRPFYKMTGVTVPKRSVTYKKKPGAKRKKSPDVTEGCGYSRIKLIEFNPGSRVHIANRLKHLHGWEPKEFTNSGLPKIDETTLDGLPYPEAKLLNEYIMVQKRLGQLEEGNGSWLKAVKNGRIHGSYMTNGTVTGRAIHHSPNIAQVPKVAVAYGKECRSLFRASPGNMLVGVDLSALELRCLSHYMAKFDDGAYGRELLEGDIHTTNQTAAGLPSRDDAKTFIYALLYGAGAERIGSIVGGSARKGQMLKSRFLKQTPALATLIESVTRKAQSGTIKGLDGRLITIRSSHAALNSLLQSAGALISKRWLVEIEDGLAEAGLSDQVSLVAWVHDEVQLEVKNVTDRHTTPDGRNESLEGTSERVKRIACDAARKAGEYFELRIPIDAEGAVGANWADTH